MAKDIRQNVRSLKETIESQEAEPLDLPIIPPLPLLLPNSGLYVYSAPFPSPVPVPIPQPVPIPIPNPDPGPQFDQDLPSSEDTENLDTSSAIVFVNEDLRVDVDGHFPQMRASGRIAGLLVAEANWIANVAKTGTNTYEGPIWYKEGNVALIPYTKVKIQVSRTAFGPTSATATFTGAGSKVRVYKYKSRYFRQVNLEFDCAQGVTATLSYVTNSHPNRPAGLPAENLTIANVFRRMGFEVSISAGNNVIPIAAAGVDAKWSDSEMHDAMQVHWSKFINAPQWALWTLFASLHETGTSLGGIMFDDIGPNHRQGTSLFVDSFIKNAPPGDAAPAAWVQRMIFWTACHEMGHAFNLAHSWQKALGTPWIPLANEPLARSFMNYPYAVPGGQVGFFSDFMFRFSNQELLFVRHAPFKFVQQGNADWFDHHGFREMRVSAEPKLKLDIETPRASSDFEFLEPVVVHLKLKNVSDQPQLVDDKILTMTERMTVVIKKQGKPARQLLSYAQRCWQEKQIVLEPGREISDSLFLSVGRNGWDVAEPGNYYIQVTLHLEEEDIVSTPLLIRVRPAKGYEEELIAQDFFTDAVGRVLTFDGSEVLDSANEALVKVVQELPDSSAAIHARVALAAPKAVNSKHVEVDGDVITIRESPSQAGEARKLLSVLTDKRKAAVATLG
ncbi:MAG TPA: hypothetical protein VFR18_21280, partial [Terriglobia bacterium]|nr:hypothetical protein [Terriglobia bacterium]